MYDPENQRMQQCQNVGTVLEALLRSIPIIPVRCAKEQCRWNYKLFSGSQICPGITIYLPLVTKCPCWFLFWLIYLCCTLLDGQTPCARKDPAQNWVPAHIHKHEIWLPHQSLPLSPPPFKLNGIRVGCVLNRFDRVLSWSEHQMGPSLSHNPLLLAHLTTLISLTTPHSHGSELYFSSSFFLSVTSC